MYLTNHCVKAWSSNRSHTDMAADMGPSIRKHHEEEECYLSVSITSAAVLEHQLQKIAEQFLKPFLGVVHGAVYVHSANYPGASVVPRSSSFCQPPPLSTR